MNTLVLIYNSFGDPLFQNLVLKYIKRLSEKTDGSFYLVTFEQERYKLSEAELQQVKKELEKYRIYFHPLTFHSGKFILIKKLYDFIQAFIKIAALRIKHKTKLIFCFANVSASIGIVLSKLLRMRMLVYSYEPHSDFQVELGLWKEKSLKHKILSGLEKYAGNHADYIMTGTQHMVDQLQQQKVKGEVYRAPTAVDPEEFYFQPEGRKKIREELNLQDDQYVMLYIGKFGNLYYTEEIPIFFAQLKQRFPNLFFLVVTSNDHSEITSLFKKQLTQDTFHITGNLSYDAIKDYLSASDIGISGVPPSPSQKFRSPTKIAEYLLCGLPYITTSGVAEDDTIATENNVGLVVDHFTNQLSQEQENQLKQLINEDKNLLRKRCRAVGMDYRSMERIDTILENIYNVK